MPQLPGKIKSILKEYFTFNRRERNGILSLLLILIAIQIARVIILNQDGPEIQIKLLEQAVSEVESQSIDRRTNHTIATKKNNIPAIKAKIDYFNFDPNTISKEQWMRLGLSGKQAKVVLKYVAKGGKFQKPEDLKKIFVISEEKYLQLEPWILIKQDKRASKDDVISRKTENPEIINKPEPFNIALKVLELNMIDSINILQVPGVGPAFARRIIKYRRKLGGYTDLNQLKEVWGMDSSRFYSIKDYFTVNDSLIEQVSINSATFKELLQHPYLDFNHVKIIVNYRRKHGPFDSPKSFMELETLSDSLRQKIIPYISFE